eukprot:GEMP01006404.1.p1 GENE.GEMP01006404.1~~GEMP01006404.1.p1  ORF type:complete len:1022 (+),score=155.44 GEMP01006404.1:141-3206(+)
MSSSLAASPPPVEGLDFGCNPCHSTVRWVDLQHQVAMLAILWLGVGVLGCVVVRVVRMSELRISEFMKHRLRAWEHVFSANAVVMCYMLMFHGVQCILFVERSYFSHVTKEYAIIEVMMSWVYVIEVMVWFLSGTLYGEWRRWRKQFRLLTLDIFLLGAPIARTFVIDGYQSWFSFSFLAGFRCARVVTRYMRVSGHKHKSATGALGTELFIQFCAVFGCAAVIMALETVDGPFELKGPYDRISPDPELRRWSFAATVYYIISTVTTVGYGDYRPASALGRLFAIGSIICGVTLFSILLNQVFEVYELTRQGQGSFKRKMKKHIVITGVPTMETIENFIIELFHPDHVSEAQEYDICLLLSNTALVEAVRARTEKHDWLDIRDHITSLRGSPLIIADCKRVCMTEAECVFVLPALDTLNPDIDDNENVLRLMSIKRIVSSKVRVVGLLHLAKQKPYLLAVGFKNADISVVEEFKFSCVGKTCGGFPGFSTLVCNLVQAIEVAHETRNDQRPVWQKEYECGLNFELYEVPLVVYYLNIRFRAVMYDLLERAEDHDVLLIGVVNANGDVLLNPGQEYKIQSGDKGVILAPDRACIKQNDFAGQLLGLPIIAQAVGKPLQHVTKAEGVAAKDQEMLKLRLQTNRQGSGVARSQLWRSSEEETCVDVRPAGFRECLHEMLIESKTSLGALNLVLENIGNQGKTNKLKAKEKENTAPANPDLKLPPIPDDELPSNFVGDHVLFCALHGSDKAPWGLELLCHTLKHKTSESVKPPTLVVLAPAKPPEWDELYIRKYFFKGSPLNLFDLERAMFRAARAIFISAQGSNHDVTDSDVIYITRLIETQMEDNSRVITELSHARNHFLLPLGHTGYAVQLLEKNRTKRQVQTLTNDLMDAMKTQEYYQSARYAQGNIFVVGKVMTSLMANALFNPSLPALAISLIKHQCFMIDVPNSWDQKFYSDFMSFLFLERDLLAVAIYRNGRSMSHHVGAKACVGMVYHSYLFACPSLKTLISTTDRILCLVKGEDS